MKNILFVASEPSSQSPTQCSEEHRRLQEIKVEGRFRDRFSVTLWDGATSDSLINMLKKLAPEYIHYCGHGNSDGEPLVIGHDGKNVSFRTETLAKYLKQNPRLDCVVFCSCNSANLVEEIKAYSNYSIGFIGNVDNIDMHQFTEDFYEELFQLGSPFHAYLNTIDKIRERRQQGNSLIFRTKLNHIMESALNRQLTIAQAGAAATENKIQLTDRLLKQIEIEIVSVKQSYNIDFNLIMRTHPTPDEVIWFSNAKDQLASEVASILYRKKSLEESNNFARELEILYFAFETALVYYQDEGIIKNNILSSINTSNYALQEYVEALEELKYIKFGFNPSEDFRVLYNRTIDLATATLLNHH